jgi:nitrite reductase (NADH) large subunit
MRHPNGEDIMRYLILGSGPAGIAAAKGARRLDKDAEIVIATEEYAAPYLRPVLPDLVSGERELSVMSNPQAKDLGELEIGILHGKRASRVDAAKNRVSFTDGSEETYNFLCIATGGRPVVPPALLAFPGSFLFLNSLGDAQRLRERAMRSDVTVVYGPGYLGIETARALRMAGNQVTWINPGLPRFGNPIPPEIEAQVTAVLREKGVKTRDGVGIADVIDIDGRNFEVVTTEGERIRCSLVVAATERFPVLGFLEGSGVKAGAGVLVSEYLGTNVSNIYAAGDCAEVYDINRRESRLNFGWRSAIKQGQLAGENMAGGGGVYIKNTEDYFGLLFGSPLLDRIK